MTAVFPGSRSRRIRLPRLVKSAMAAQARSGLRRRGRCREIGAAAAGEELAILVEHPRLGGRELAAETDHLALGGEVARHGPGVVSDAPIHWWDAAPRLPYHSPIH